MANTILVCGYGPGISSAVAETFGARGFSVALVARTKERLDAGVKALAAKGIKACAVPADLSDPSAAAAAVERARKELGPVSVVHWNAYSGAAGDLTTASATEIHTALDVALTSLLTTLQSALPDMRKAERPSLLVTNGGFGRLDPSMDAACVQYNAMGLGIANAAKDKLVGMLAKKLESDKVYVGQITILGMVKGTPFDQGNATIDPRDVATKFWSMYEQRTTNKVDFS